MNAERSYWEAEAERDDREDADYWGDLEAYWRHEEEEEEDERRTGNTRN